MLEIIRIIALTLSSILLLTGFVLFIIMELFSKCKHEKSSHKHLVWNEHQNKHISIQRCKKCKKIIG